MTTLRTGSGPGSERGRSIRSAARADVPAILGLVHELALYEKAPEAVEATPDQLRAALFPQDGGPTAFAHVAVVDGTVVGMAIWFVTFSTWLGRSGIWLEDLYVSPEHRGSGLGKDLLATLAAVCAGRGYGRLDWSVLRWNTPSIGFYDSIGGEADGRVAHLSAGRPCSGRSGREERAMRVLPARPQGTWPLARCPTRLAG